MTIAEWYKHVVVAVAMVTQVVLYTRGTAVSMVTQALTKMAPQLLR